MAHVKSSLLIPIFILLLAQPVRALELGRNLPQSARDVEFFYQHKKQESLSGILRAFDTKNRFKNGEMRLIIAAFLSEISRKDRNHTKDIFASASDFSVDGQKMLLWAVHLAGLPPKDAFDGRLPVQCNEVLCNQIERSPKNVLKWDLLASRTVVYMYLGAFFAHADMRYIDALLGTTKLFARLQKEGRIEDPLYQHTQFIAAVLFEMAQRHPCVRRHMENKRKALSNADATVLDRILSGTKTSQP